MFFVVVYESVLKACYSYPIYFFVDDWNIRPTDTVYAYLIEHELGMHIF